MNLLDYLFAVIPMLGILIFVHELGHFVVAKACGVRVLKFSLGFGPPIGFGNLRMRWERGGTEYVIAWFPLGGFVKMLGEQMGGIQGEEEEVVADARPDEYLNAKPTWQKLAITFAGPLMNLLLPVVVFAGVLAMGLPQPSATIGTVEFASPAEQAGLRVDDRVLSVAGVPADTWDDIDRAIRENPGETIALEVERGGETLAVSLPVQRRSGLDDFGKVAEVGWAGVGHRRLPALLGIPRTNTAAEAAGLRSGDRVLSIGGGADAAEGQERQEVADWEGLRRLYAEAHAAGQREVALGIARIVDDERQDLTIRVPVMPDILELGVIPGAILISSVSKGMPAEEVGLLPGDMILAVAEEPVGSFATFAEIVRSSEGRSLEITYSRAGVTHDVAIAARETEVPGPLEIEGMEQKIYLIGIRPASATLPGAEHIEQVLNPLVAIPRAFGMTVDVSLHFLEAMGMLFKGDVGLDNVAGPIGIAEIARKSLDRGWMHYLSTLILISVNLGFLNLLPIPVLDGGQALIIMVEGIKRSPISMRSREIVQQIGLTFLMMLMGLAFWNDLSRHWTSFVEWLSGVGL